MLGSRIASTTVLVTALLAWTMPETQARFTPIVTYAPMTKVTDVAALDLDQNELERQLGLGALNNARAVYERGGNSLSIANLTLVNPPGPMSYPQGTQVLGRTKGSANTTVLGILVDESVTWGALPGNVTIHVQYVTSTNQTTYSDCQSGGLWTFSEANLNGCYNDQGHVTLVPPGESANRGDKLAYKYDIRQDNWNLRTLQSLSTNADTSMRPCPGCPFYADFQTFVNYYETTEYADSWIMAAALNRSVAFPSGRGNANFGAAFTSGSKLGLAEAVKKGTAYMSVFMQIIRDLEDAMTDCDNKCDPDDLSCQDIGAEAVHSLDAAVALYAGSLEGTDGTENSGVMPYALANRRAADFRTGGPQGERSSGTAHVNYEVIKEFKHAQTRLLADECNLARQNKWRIVNLMKVPLVQGVLRYAYMRDFNNPSDAPTREKEQAEGATFAAALLPFVHKCDTADATLIYNNMRIGSDANKVVFADVKAALERNYGCMGISCPLVGGFHNGQDYERGATPCTEGTLQGPAAPDFSQLPSSSGGSGGGNAGVAVGWILAVCLAGVVGFMAYRRFGKRKNIADVMKPPANNLAAVSEIA